MLTTIYTLFPIPLIIGLILAALLRKKEESKALIYYTAIYFSTDLPFRIFSPDYESRLAYLALASFALILLYHSLHITVFILCAWLCELGLIALNFFAIHSVRLSPREHWEISVILNLIRFAFIAGNFWYGNSGINKRLYHWGKPPALAPSRRMAFREKGKGVVA